MTPRGLKHLFVIDISHCSIFHPLFKALNSLEIIVKHGKPAERLCNKDPFTLKSTKYLIDLFPNARFILMLRDGRATAHSIISRQVTISGFDITSYRDVLTKVCIHPTPCIGSQMRMKNSVGEECVMKFLGSRG